MIALKKIRQLIMGASEVVSIKELTARNSGSYLFVQASLIFRVADLKRLHLASWRIEAKIRAEFPNVDSVKNILRYAAALQ